LFKDDSFDTVATQVSTVREAEMVEMERTTSGQIETRKADMAPLRSLREELIHTGAVVLDGDQENTFVLSRTSAPNFDEDPSIEVIRLIDSKEMCCAVITK